MWRRVAVGAGEGAGGRARRVAGAVLQGGVRVPGGGRRRALALGRRAQVRARAVPAAVRGAGRERRAAAPVRLHQRCY